MRLSTDTPPTVMALLALALLGGCDGGIFGTGSGDDADAGALVDSSGDGGVDAPDGAPEGGETGGSGDGGGTTGTTDGTTDGDATGGDTGPADPSDGGSPADLVPVPLENTLETGTATVPRVRVVNADTASRVLALVADGDDGTDASIEIAPGEVGAPLEVPLGSAGLRLSRPDGEPLVVLAPLALAPSSVTTLLLRDAEAGDGDVVALPTRIASGDPGVALARVVAGSRLDDPDGPPSTTALGLAPDGASPGATEVTLGVPDFDAPAAAYVAVGAGDYRLEDPDGRVAPAPLTLEGGAVYTLVVGVPGRETPLVVVDSALR